MLHIDIWAFISIVTSVLALYCIKMYIFTKNIYYIVGAILCYMLQIYVNVKIYSNNNMVILYPFLKVAVTLCIVALGIIIFGDVLTVKMAIGILFACGAIYLLK